MSSVSDLGAIDAGSIRFRRLRVGVVLIGLTVMLAVAGSSTYDAWRSHRYAVEATDRELVNLANALAEQTAWSLQSVDLLLLDTAQWYRSDGQKIAPGRRDDELASRVAGLPQVRRVLIIDAEGTPRYGPRGTTIPNVNVSDRSYFIAQRDHGDTGLYMSEPLVTRSEGRSAIILSRRLEDAGGTFAGIVTANLDLDGLERLYRAVDLGSGGAIQLLRDDGTLIARHPSRPDAIGSQFPAFARLTQDPPSRMANPIDGTADFIAAAKVRNSALLLVVTREAAAALHPWYDETLRVGIRTLILTLLGAMIMAALLRQLRRIEAGERALRESEERYALAMEGANEGHWDWHVDTDRLFLSPKMKLLYGQQADSAIDSRRAWMDSIVIHPDDFPRFEAAIAEHFAGCTARYECEYRVRQTDGSWRWLLGRGRCLFDASHRPYRFVGSAIDVTEQKQSQTDNALLEAQLRQSQKMEAMGTLAGGIAHDFNNILGAILGYGELAQQHAADGSSLRRYLDNVMHAAERAQTLVKRILGFSRSGLGDHVPVNVQFVIEETLELLDASMPAGIRLESRIEAGNAAVLGDATDLHQVAMNLCTNAIHAMEHGGVLRVVLERCDLSESRAATRGSLAAGPYVRLEVSDSGVGIPPGVLDRMFDPFFTTKGVGEGTGLGLSLVHGIVTDLKGAIDVTTEAGRGTRFEIWLPIAGEVTIPTAEAAAQLPRGHGEAVMIVDDEQALVSLAEEIIAQLGYEPVGFVSSTAALQAFRAAPDRFDAVLTDESMPDLAGTEFARQIRQLRGAVPIILMSGYGGAQFADRVAELGLNEVLRKPLHSRDLAEALSRSLSSTG